MANDPKRGARQNARILAMQCLYAWLHTDTPIQESKLYLLSHEDWHKDKPLDHAYLNALLNEVEIEVESFKPLLFQYGARPLVQITPIEQAICMVAMMELKHQWTVPKEVIINESVEIAKDFAADNAHKFVNGVLDKVAKVLRPASDK
jgi:N utilization substance protein B